MTTAADNEGHCYNCGSTRQACDARTDWPLRCCPSCLRTSAWGAHVVGDPAEPPRMPQLVAPMMGRP
jgi:hypothetical protein